jgi:hypothetical protein
VVWRMYLAWRSIQLRSFYSKFASQGFPINPSKLGLFQEKKMEQ